MGTQTRPKAMDITNLLNQSPSYDSHLIATHCRCVTEHKGCPARRVFQSIAACLSLRPFLGDRVPTAECWFCGRKDLPLSRCARCTVATYCSPSCQGRDWILVHRFRCCVTGRAEVKNNDWETAVLNAWEMMMKGTVGEFPSIYTGNFGKFEFDDGRVFVTAYWYPGPPENKPEANSYKHIPFYRRLHF